GANASTRALLVCSGAVTRAPARASHPLFSRRQMLRAGALLLDMDGLMVDSEPLWYEVERAFAHARGGLWTIELAHACIGKGLASTLLAMTERFGFATDLEKDGHELVESFIARVGELALKPGCAELLDAARG